MKKLIVTVVLALSIAAIGFYAVADSPLPPLRDGDLIFHTSTSRQSAAILFATADRFSHMGIIKHDGARIVVIEAAAQVKETPLQEWIDRGLLKRAAIYRDTELTETQAQKIVASAKTLYGKPYDIFFSFNNDAIYCSELPYLAYQGLGISIGRIEKLSELNFDNMLVKRLIRQRWQRDPECSKMNFEECYASLLERTLVTPASVAEDGRFQRIYSNYPF